MVSKTRNGSPQWGTCTIGSWINTDLVEHPMLRLMACCPQHPLKMGCAHSRSAEKPVSLQSIGPSAAWAGITTRDKRVIMMGRRSRMFERKLTRSLCPAAKRNKSVRGNDVNHTRKDEREPTIVCREGERKGGKGHDCQALRL